jgi:hypothetical protein
MRLKANYVLNINIHLLLTISLLIHLDKNFETQKYQTTGSDSFSIAEHSRYLSKNTPSSGPP